MSSSEGEDEELASFSTSEHHESSEEDEDIEGFSSPQNQENTLQQEMEQDAYVYPYTTSWFDMPEELREMVIDKIDPITVFRFKQCSKLCGEEARRSKNSMYKIELNSSEKGTHICFHLTNEYPNCPHFRYTFRETGLRKWKNTTIVHEKMEYEDWSQDDCDEMIYVAERNDDYDVCESSYTDKLKEEQWRTLENGDHKSIVAKNFEKHLEEYEHSVKCFIYNDHGVRIGNFHMTNLRNLQHIEIDTIDVLEKNILSIEQIAKCREKVSLSKTELTFDQFIQLKAEYIDIRIKHLTNEQIKRYLKMWENGEIDENVQHIMIKLGGLKVLEQQYYTDGLLTVFEREPATKKYRSTRNQCSFEIKCPRQYIISVWLSENLITINRRIQENRHRAIPSRRAFH
ncbi:unnamed protein product [Caenorhabditis angaria]|uniref:F-box domain-containing protein n=1 Tax=Caenorhabditis angaria TaxID=860376 RepID=A0A9P1MTX8_9PELO|nr:unnamed protein product [Caenorhabditis angaria]